MIDFVKVWLPAEAASNIRGNLEKLGVTFTSHRNGSGAEVAEHFGITIVLQPGGGVALQGSLHYFSNCGEHNHDDFTADRLRAAVVKLADLLSFDPASARIQNLEIGVNITVPHDVPYTAAEIAGRLVAWGKHPFTANGGGEEWTYRQAGEGTVLKVYDKGEQFQLPEKVLRLELKLRRSRAIKRRSWDRMYTLVDLKRPANLLPLAIALLDELKFVIFWEPLTEKTMSDKDRVAWAELTNPLVWQQANHKKAARLRKEYIRLLDRYATRPVWRAEVHRLATEKVAVLLPESLCGEVRKDDAPTPPKAQKKGTKTTIVKTTKRYKNRLMIKEGIVSFSTASASPEIIPISVPDTATPSERQRRCLATGVDITNQLPATRVVTKNTLVERPELYAQLVHYYRLINGNHAYASEANIATWLRSLVVDNEALLPSLTGPLLRELPRLLERQGTF